MNYILFVFPVIPTVGSTPSLGKKQIHVIIIVQTFIL